ncbi:MHF histone-fold complex component [Oleoguttula sp. CCFEE 5521]
MAIENADKEERLKAALWYSVGQTIDAHTDINATAHFIGSLSEMLYAQIENVSQDLETFAKHAGRTTINSKDVLLLARRNEGLEEVLKQEAKAVKDRDSAR